MSEPQGDARASEEQIDVRDGRYEGGDADVFVVFRVDATGTGVVSADVYRVGPGSRDFVASVRTAPGTRLTSGGTAGARWPAVWQDSTGLTALGQIGVTGVAGHPDVVTGVLRLDERLNGLPAGRDITLSLNRAGAEMRELGVEVETEEGVAVPNPVAFNGQTLTFRECLRAAGFTAAEAGKPTTIPRQVDGWDASSPYTVLNDLMRESAQTPTDRPDWDLHALLLSKAKSSPTSPGALFGVMFDDTEVLPRQGCAIFVETIRQFFPDTPDRKIIHTTVHELGHALNLRHRFEREIGAADSTSFMNYDWRFRRGDMADEYWQQFAFTFDDDELEFLRHGPRASVIPGGDRFTSAEYWSRGTGGYSPYYPEVPFPGLRLALVPPPAGTLFLYGQPVFLEITLENRMTEPIGLPADVLDPKGSWLEFRIIRRTGAPATIADGMSFAPMMTRCYDQAGTPPITVPAGGKIRNNVNLTFGTSGFAFAEPGTYDVIPIVGFVQDSEELGQRIERIVTGRPLRITIAYPHSIADERDAMVLFRPDVGVWFALGGAACLPSARDDLAEVRERRIAQIGAADPIAAAITRAAGLDAARPEIRYRDGGFVERPGEPDRAAALFSSLDPVALAAFDRHTAAGTAALAKAYQDS